MKIVIRTALLFALSICSSLHAQAQTTAGDATSVEARPFSTQARYRGKVIEVSGGDTLIVALDNKKVSIRLLGVSAIKKGHDFSKESRENLARLLRHKTIEVVANERPSQVNPESPMTGKVLLDGQDVGLEQIRGGFAYISQDDVKYQTEEDRQLYKKAEGLAQEEDRGMWNDKYKCKDDPSRQRQGASPVSQTNDIIKAKVRGVVRVRVTIDESGKVISAKAECGLLLLREAAENAALGARFSRTFMSGFPVRVTGVIIYNFVAE